MDVEIRSAMMGIVKGWSGATAADQIKAAELLVAYEPAVQVGPAQPVEKVDPAQHDAEGPHYPGCCSKAEQAECEDCDAVAEDLADVVLASTYVGDERLMQLVAAVAPNLIGYDARTERRLIAEAAVDLAARIVLLVRCGA